MSDKSAKATSVKILSSSSSLICHHPSHQMLACHSDYHFFQQKVFEEVSWTWNVSENWINSWLSQWYFLQKKKLKKKNENATNICTIKHTHISMLVCPYVSVWNDWPTIELHYIYSAATCLSLLLKHIKQNQIPANQWLREVCVSSKTGRLADGRTDGQLLACCGLQALQRPPSPPPPQIDSCQFRQTIFRIFQLQFTIRYLVYRSWWMPASQPAKYEEAAA